MTPEERIRSRLDELAGLPPGFHGADDRIAWASNVLTVARQLLGPEDFRVHSIQDSITRFTRSTGLQRDDLENYFVQEVLGVLLGLKSDFEGGHLSNIRNQIRTEVETDFLSQAHRLLEDGFKDPAAMLIGAVLEDALRQLSRAHSLAEGDNIESMNVPLRTAGVYGLPQQQQVTAWAAIRNKADHARFSQYDIAEVRLMHQGVADFISKYLA
jgi:hypothetical protein